MPTSDTGKKRTKQNKSKDQRTKKVLTDVALEDHTGASYLIPYIPDVCRGGLITFSVLFVVFSFSFSVFLSYHTQCYDDF